MAIAVGARILADDMLARLRAQMGQVSVSFTTQTSFTVAVTFPVAFPVGSNINVHCNIASGIGATSGWHSRAINITNTGFTVFVFGGSSTWSGVAVQWTAFSSL